MLSGEMARLQVPLLPRWLRWSVVVAVAATILYYSVFTPPGSGAVRTGPFGVLPYSTWLHGLAYGGFAATLAYAVQDSAWRDRSVLAVAFLVAVGYGAGIELLQSTLDARTADFGDLVVNAVGAAIAAVCWGVLTRRVRFYPVGRLGELELPVQ
jgi:VanZ family protein